MSLLAASEYADARHRRVPSPGQDDVTALGMLDGLLLIVEAQKRRFPEGLDPFKMVTRLLEECGELATEVQVWEDEGLKRSKHGEPDRGRTASEIVNVLTATLTIADHYGLVPDVAEQVELAVERAAAHGHLSPGEVRRHQG